MVQGHPRQKLVRPYLKNKPGIVMYICGLSYSGVGDRRITIQGQTGQKHETVSKKQAKCKKDWRVWLERYNLA
jgi:hypothetical protein